MSEKIWARHTTGMLAHAHRRKEEKHQRVDEVIPQRVRQSQTINVHSVAKAAGVSKTYVSSQSDLRERIESLRQHATEQRGRERATCPTPGKTDARKDLVIRAKDRRMREREAENRHRKKQ